MFFIPAVLFTFRGCFFFLFKVLSCTQFLLSAVEKNKTWPFLKVIFMLSFFYVESLHYRSVFLRSRLMGVRLGFDYGALVI